MPKKISDSELVVLRALWRGGKPLSFTEIRKDLEERTQWSKSTIQTLIIRLRDKEIIRTIDDYVILYAPNISEDEYLQAEEQKFLDRLFDGSAKKLAAALCRSGRLGEDDIDELKAFFKVGGDSE